MLERMANLLADGRAARFAEDLHGVSQLAQLLYKQWNLRAFAAAFVALECDE